MKSLFHIIKDMCTLSKNILLHGIITAACTAYSSYVLRIAPAANAVHKKIFLSCAEQMKSNAELILMIVFISTLMIDLYDKQKRMQR